MYMAWNIWKEINSHVIDGKSNTSSLRLKKHELSLHVRAHG